MGIHYLTCKCSGHPANIHFSINRHVHVENTLITVDPTSAYAWYLLRCQEESAMCQFFQLTKYERIADYLSLSFAELENIWFSLFVRKTSVIPTKRRTRRSQRSAQNRLSFYRLIRSFYSIDISCNDDDSSVESIELESLSLTSGQNNVLSEESNNDVTSPEPELSQHPSTSQDENTASSEQPVVMLSDVPMPEHQSGHELVPAIIRCDNPVEAVRIDGETYLTRLKQYLRTCVYRSVAYFSPGDKRLSKMYALHHPLARYRSFYVFSDFSYFPYAEIPVVLRTNGFLPLPPREYPYLVVDSPNTLDFTIGEANLNVICGLPIDEAYQLLKSVIGLKGYVTLKSPSR